MMFSSIHLSANRRLQWSLARTYLLTRKRQSILSLLGVMLGVSFFIAIAAMMSGFQSYFLEKVVEASPHIAVKDEFRSAPKQAVQIANPYADVMLHGLKPKDEIRGIRNAAHIIRQIETNPRLIASPSLQGQIFLRYGSKEVSITAKGILPDKERKISHIENDMTSGSLDDLKTTSNGIIIGEGVARKLGADRGDTVTAISPRGVVMPVKITGIFYTGIVTADDAMGMILLKKSQILQEKNDKINLINIKVSGNVYDAQKIAHDLEQRFEYRAESWQETNANIFNIFVIQNVIMYSTVSAILIVSGFGIYNIISTAVNDKHKDIAILKSMGFSADDIRMAFLLQGIIVGAAGTLLGWVLGFGLIVFMGSLDFTTEGFVRVHGFILNDTPAHYIISGALAFTAAAVSSLIPAHKAASIDPVDILRGAV